MNRFALRLSLLGLLGVSAAAHAGTVYVPLPGVSSVGASGYEVEVSITNTATQVRTVNQLQVATDTDGTQRGAASPLQVQPGRTLVIKPAASARGLLELSGSSELRFSARLVGTGAAGKLGVPLPIITSENLARGNQTVTLQGLLLTATRAADLTVVNLGHQTSQCTINLTRADGTAIGTGTTVTLKALSHRSFANVLNGLAATGTTDARAAISCSREFYAFALLSDSAAGEASLILPSGTGDSALQIPGQGPACPVGSQCWEVQGIVHQPTVTNPLKRVSFAPQAGTYTKIRLSMDVFHGGWNPANTSALHELFWLVKNRNFDMFGYATFRGPSKNISLLRHGIGLTHPQKIKITKPFTAKPGKNYHVEYTYDTVAKVLALEISDNGQVVQRLTGTPNVSNFGFGPGDSLIVDIGFDGSNSDEQPTLGWIYRNLRIELSQ